MASKKKKTTKKAKRSKRPSAAEQVEILAACGLRDTDIALALGVSQRTIRRRYREQLDHGRTIVAGKVGMALVRRALDDDHPQSTTCAIFYLKCQAGWKEKSALDVNVTERSGVLLAPTPMTPDAWISMMRDADSEKPDPRNGTNGAP